MVSNVLNFSSSTLGLFSPVISRSWTAGIEVRKEKRSMPSESGSSFKPMIVALSDSIAESVCS